jgi:hypothetical protein
MGRVLAVTSLRLSLSPTHPLNKKPTLGILEGGAYGSQEKSQEESQEEKKVAFEF